MSESGKTPSAFWQAVRANHKLQHQAPVINPGPRSGKIPLSFGQERLWLVDQLQSGTTAHNLRAVFRLQGPLDLTALEKSLQEIIGRHEILRTTFPAVDGHPVQVILPTLTLQLLIVNLEKLTPAQQEAESNRLAMVEAQEPFDLTQAPLFRLKLLRLAEEEHVLLRTIHHIINDRWSDGVFMGELAACYQAFSNGQSSPLADLPIQYADFAICQRQRLQGDILESQLNYWRQQLGDHLTPVQLPADGLSPATLTYQGDAQYITLTADLTKSLKRLGQQAEVSLFVVLLAAFKTLLYQYSGQSEITLCSPVAGRNQVETKKLIGYFSNLVLFRTSIEEDLSFRALISRVSQVTLGAFEHQDLPLQQIADSLNVPGAVLSRAMFALQNVPSPPREMAGIKITPLDIPEGIANFDLSLSMKRKDEQLIGVLRYKTALFQEATMTRLLENFQVLLQHLVANPDLRLADLPRFREERPTQCLRNVVEEAVYVAPVSEIERTVAAIWQEVFQQDRISMDANFFDIGGRSLTLVQIGSRLQQVVGQAIPVRELFKHATIRGMSQFLTRQKGEEQSFSRLTSDRVQQQREALRRQQQQMKLRRSSHG